MILGVDHIALSATDVTQDAERLAGEGYRIKFVNPDVPNAPEKRSLLRQYEAQHGMAYCQSDRGIAIELTQHARISPSREASYRVLFNRLPRATQSASADPCISKTWQSALGVSDTKAVWWEEFRGTIWGMDNDRPNALSIQAVMLPVADLRAAERFWAKGLRCHLIDRGTGTGRPWLRMRVNSPIAAWSLNLIISEEAPINHPPSFDDDGFTCLALLTNRLEADCEASLASGAIPVTGVFNIEVEGKSLDIAILRGPNKELIELIQFQRN
jgi:hypothetical protein